MRVYSLSSLFWIFRSVVTVTSSGVLDESFIDRILKDSNDLAAGLWSSLTPDLDFARILGDSKYDKVTEQILDRSLSTPSIPVASSDSCSFLSTSENDYYPEYAIAWRFLGISVDCNYQGNNHRSLENNNNICSRVILYAVYVDVNHDENLGLDQYSFYDRKYKTWSQCGGKYTVGDESNSNRCVKMDCHTPDTEHFKLLGLYKNYDMNTWMEQLFKHEGVCVWTSDEYSVGQSIRDSVKANQCVAAGADPSGTILYGGISGLPGGNFGITLYTDSSCYEPYKGETNVDGLCGSTCNSNNNNNKMNRDLKNNNNGVCGFYCYANAFNDAMNVWKQCQPCTAYTPGYYGSYQCSDAAGYNNCLQCMKFRAKAGSVPADISDLVNAVTQQSITSIKICNTTFGGEYGYGYPGDVPTFGASMKLQSDALNLVTSYSEPPSDHSKPFFIVSIISMVLATGFFLYQYVLKTKSKGASLRGNEHGVMS